MEKFLKEIAVSVFGRFFSSCIKIGRMYMSNLSLSKCNVVGHAVVVGADFIVDNQGFISIEDNTIFSGKVLLSCYKGGQIVIGRNTFFGDNVKIVSDTGSIIIGSNSLIAEDVSIRASNHGLQANKLIRLQKNRVSNITIGSDVWIGKGVAVLAGVKISDGCVIGANSVVTKSTDTNTIYAGVPARAIHRRE